MNNSSLMLSSAKDISSSSEKSLLSCLLTRNGEQGGVTNFKLSEIFFHILNFLITLFFYIYINLK